MEIRLSLFLVEEGKNPEKTVTIDNTTTCKQLMVKVFDKKIFSQIKSIDDYYLVSKVDGKWNILKEYKVISELKIKDCKLIPKLINVNVNVMNSHISYVVDYKRTKVIDDEKSCISDTVYVKNFDSKLPMVKLISIVFKTYHKDGDELLDKKKYEIILDHRGTTFHVDKVKSAAIFIAKNMKSLKCLFIVRRVYWDVSVFDYINTNKRNINRSITFRHFKHEYFLKGEPLKGTNNYFLATINLLGKFNNNIGELRSEIKNEQNFYQKYIRFMPPSFVENPDHHSLTNSVGDLYDYISKDEGGVPLFFKHIWKFKEIGDVALSENMPIPNEVLEAAFVAEICKYPYIGQKFIESTFTDSNRSSSDVFMVTNCLRHDPCLDLLDSGFKLIKSFSLQKAMFRYDSKKIRMTYDGGTYFLIPKPPYDPREISEYLNAFYKVEKITMTPINEIKLLSSTEKLKKKDVVKKVYSLKTDIFDLITSESFEVCFWELVSSAQINPNNMLLNFLSQTSDTEVKNVLSGLNQSYTGLNLIHILSRLILRRYCQIDAFYCLFYLANKLTTDITQKISSTPIRGQGYNEMFISSIIQNDDQKGYMFLYIYLNLVYETDQNGCFLTQQIELIMTIYHMCLYCVALMLSESQTKIKEFKELRICEPSGYVFEPIKCFGLMNDIKKYMPFVESASFMEYHSSQDFFTIIDPSLYLSAFYKVDSAYKVLSSPVSSYFISRKKVTFNEAPLDFRDALSKCQGIQLLSLVLYMKDRVLYHELSSKMSIFAEAIITDFLLNASFTGNTRSCVNNIMQLMIFVPNMSAFSLIDFLNDYTPSTPVMKNELKNEIQNFSCVYGYLLSSHTEAEAELYAMHQVLIDAIISYPDSSKDMILRAFYNLVFISLDISLKYKNSDDVRDRFLYLSKLLHLYFRCPQDNPKSHDIKKKLISKLRFVTFIPSKILDTESADEFKRADNETNFKVPTPDISTEKAILTDIISILGHFKANEKNA